MEKETGKSSQIADTTASGGNQRKERMRGEEEGRWERSSSALPCVSGDCRRRMSDTFIFMTKRDDDEEDDDHDDDDDDGAAGRGRRWLI